MMLGYKFLPTTFAAYLNEIFYLIQRFGIFFLFEKENACKRKAKQGEIPLYPRERRAAVHSLLFSVGSSAHSPANALELERVRARAAYKVRRSLASSVSLYHCGAAIGTLCIAG